MLFKQERPEKDDFGRKTNVGCKGKYRNTSIPLQNLHKIFLHIFLFQNILSIFCTLSIK